MLSEIGFIIKAFWLIVIGFIKTVQSFLECARDVWTRFVVPSPRSAVYTNGVSELLLFFLIVLLFSFGVMFLTRDDIQVWKPMGSYLTQYECPDKHAGVFTNQKPPKCKVCGKKMEEVKE